MFFDMSKRYKTQESIVKCFLICRNDIKCKSQSPGNLKKTLTVNINDGSVNNECTVTKEKSCKIKLKWFSTLITQHVSITSKKQD